jgi:hypothetical protein
MTTSRSRLQNFAERCQPVMRKGAVIFVGEEKYIFGRVGFAGWAVGYLLPLFGAK